jgi:hypothetical protein
MANTEHLLLMKGCLNEKNWEKGYSYIPMRVPFFSLADDRKMVFCRCPSRSSQVCYPCLCGLGSYSFKQCHLSLPSCHWHYSEFVSSARCIGSWALSFHWNHTAPLAQARDAFLVMQHCLSYGLCSCQLDLELSRPPE